MLKIVSLLHETYMKKFGIFLFIFIKFQKRLFDCYLRSVERICIFFLIMSVFTGV